MFENLTNKFEEIFSSLKKAPSLSEKEVDEGLRGIRQGLLEADVALPVAKKLIENIIPKVVGQKIIRSTTPGQMIVKIVYDELVKFLGYKVRNKFKCRSTSFDYACWFTRIWKNYNNS